MNRRRRTPRRRPRPPDNASRTAPINYRRNSLDGTATRRRRIARRRPILIRSNTATNNIASHTQPQAISMSSSSSENVIAIRSAAPSPPITESITTNNNNNLQERIVLSDITNLFDRLNNNRRQTHNDNNVQDENNNTDQSSLPQSPVINNTNNLQLSQAINDDTTVPNVRMSAQLYDRFCSRLNELQRANQILRDEMKEMEEKVVACPVCHEKADIALTVCGHLLCSTCLGRLQRDQCPCCRSTFTYMDVLRIYSQ